MIMEFMRLDAERKNPPNELQSRSCDLRVMSHESHVTPDLVHFTDEEMYGKFLDLHELHDIFCNLKGVEVGGACCHGNS